MEEIQQNFLSELDQLRIRLQEAEETLRAIRAGEVDAFVISARDGEEVFVLDGADHPYRIIVEQMNEGAVTLSAEGMILYCNKRFADLLKTPLEQVMGTSLRQYLIEEESFASAVQRNSRDTMEAQLKQSDGTLISVSLAYNLVMIDDTQCVCLVVTDLTEVKYQAGLLEQERARAEEKIRESQRLAVMGSTAAVLAHEIANPLNAMSTTVQVMQRQLATRRAESGRDDWISDYLGDLKKEIDRFAKLLNDFRSLARAPDLHAAPVDLPTLIAEVIKMFASEVEQLAIQFVQKFPSELPQINADAERLEQIFLNLFKNAIEAMPSGGNLTVTASPQGQNIVVNVTDTGSGVPEGVDIFQPFTTTKRNGTGLGLAIVRELLSAHGGTITYTSNKGNGTTFQIKLPISVSASL